MNPVDEGRDASDDRLFTGAENKAVDTDDCPRVLLVFARERTSTVTEADALVTGRL